MQIEVKSTNTKTEKTKNDTIRHKQQVALLGQGDYPLPFWIDIPEGRPYQPGLYTFSPDTFRNNRFGGIEMDPYGIKLVPLGEKAVKAA